MSDANVVIAEVSCSVCRAKCGQPCVGEYYGQGDDFNTPHGGELDEPHPERVERWESFEDVGRWPCHKPGCMGSRKAIPVGLYGEPASPLHMLSSTEGGCSDCDWWIDDPGSRITTDELLRDMAPDLVETHELIDNPDGPHTKLAASERPDLVLADSPDNPDAVMHLVPRTKPIELNPFRTGGPDDS